MGAVPTPVEPGPRMRTFRTDLLQTTAVNLGIGATNAVTGILVARLLLPGGRGELAAIMNVPTLLGTLACLGLPEALVYFSARERDRAGRYLGTSLVLSLAAAGLLTVVGWLAMPLLLSAQPDEVVSAARWYLLQVPVAAVVTLVLRPLRGLGEFRWWNALRITPTAIWLAILLVASTRQRTTPEELAIAFVVLRAATIPVYLGVVRWRIGRRLGFERDLVRPSLRYGLPNVAAVLPNELNYRLDQLLLAALLPSGALGIYVVAVAWSQLPGPVLMAFGSILFPKVAAADHDERVAIVTGGLRSAVVVSGTMAVLLALVTPTLLPLLFGDAFEPAVPTAVVLTLAAGVAGVNLVGQEAARGFGRPKVVLQAQLAGLATTVVGLVALLPGLRIFGAALASLAGYATIGAVLVVHLRRATAASWTALLVPRRSDLARIASLARRPDRGAPR